VDTFFHYDLDISTFAQSAQQAMVQFKAAGVTTVVLACDPFSVGFLTKAAAAQNYYPEWMLEGTAGTDTDTEAQTYAPSEVTGHLFGVSEANATVDIFGPTSPAGKLYQKLTGHAIPPETDGDYAILTEIFDALQAAGPNLTPQNMARGMHAPP
jgi:ABC-type branched-subunit amino acid transport system substrate-binding protein